jgi:glycosyltransferase involved in cell wall biosynthesis
MSNYKKNVIFYAPLGNHTKGHKIGGAEIGCKKTLEILKKNDYDVVLIEKPVRKSASKLDGFLSIFNLIKTWLILIKTCRNNKNAVLHIVGFYLNQIYFEFLLTRTAKFLGIETIYEIRNGGMIEALEDGNKAYKYFMRSTLLSATSILCQGYDYVVYIKKHFNKDTTYYPNYIMDDFIEENQNGRQEEKTARLIYFGRIVPDKNIEFILKVCEQLNASKFPFTLDLIGSYEESYHKTLSKQIAEYGLFKDEIKFHGRMEFKEIYKYSKRSHFFIFPSKEKREGHSNALTEAMGCGIVPIVSEAGFNSSIVSNDRLVMPQFEPLLYVDTIKSIWNNGEWNTWSNKVYDRVVNNYTESVVKKSLLAVYSAF